MTREEIRKQIREIGLVASVRVASDDAAMFAAENVLAGGVSVVEITATIPNSDLVIRDLTARFSSLVVGAEVLNGIRRRIAASMPERSFSPLLASILR